MALHDILAAMEAEVDAEIKQIAAQAEQQVAAIKAEAEQQAQTIRARLKAEQHAPIAHERARRLNRARREALNAVGHAQERWYAEAMEGAQARLHELRNEPQYPQVLRVLVMEAIDAIPGNVLLRADPRDALLLHEIVPDMEIEFDLNTAGGVEVRSLDGRIVATNTLEARLHLAQPAIRQAVMPLFGGHTHG